MFLRRLTVNVRSFYPVFNYQASDLTREPLICFFSNKVNFGRNFPSIEIDPETGEKKRKKTAIIPKITLINGDEVTVSTLEEAQKLAKRRDLKLVQIVDLDTKTQRAVYKLMTGMEYHEEDLKQRERIKAEKQKGSVKGEKVLMLNQNITEHDLQTQINKINKWLAKRYEVRMFINGNASENNKKAEDVYSYIEKHVDNQGRLLQKRQKGSDIRFQIVPPKEPKNTDNSQNKGNKGSEGPV